jgi:hypothetical protein
MNFQKQLNQIKNYTKEDLLQNHDFELDWEHLHLEECIGTGYRHKRLTSYTDQELKQLHEAVSDRIMELF